MLLLQPLIGLLLISLAHGDCPILISPVDVVVEYGDSFSANCSSTVETNQFGLSWDGYDETMKKTEDDIFVDVTNWEMNLTCYMYSNKTKCSQGLPVTIYKTPDSVSISIVDHRGPMIEGQQYELQCDIYNVAPVQELTVKWYKGQTLLNQTTFTEDNKSPVNETATLLIRPDRTDDGAQYRCEAELDLGEDGPQYPTESLQPLSAELHYKPIHSNSTETIIKNDEVTLNCTVKANPAPTYTWHSEHLKEEISSSVLQSSTLSPGNYTCTATNSLGSDSKVFIIQFTESRCPIQLIPWRAVVRYGGSVAVNCKTSIIHKGLGWEASEGAVPMTKDSLITWRVSHLTEWDIQPFCYINHKEQCQVELPVTIYKTPDSVSISIVDHRGPMIEGQQYELQCDVHDVAPVQYLTVKWYKGQTLLDKTTFTEDSKTPVNKTATLQIRPDRADDGAQYRCEAELELGAEGPQPPPKETSEPLNITVYYAPKIPFCDSWSPLTGTSLDSYPLNLDSVVGNPRPNISWRHKASSVNSSMRLTKFDSGQYEIIASNDLSDFNCSVNITVEYPPELNCSETYEVKEKTLFKFPCIADGFPKPEFSLYKNGKTIQRELFSPNWNDSGRYQLTAENPHGTINSTFTINILHAPVFYASQEDFHVKEDSNLTLECNSTGNPEPEMWLSFSNKTISTGRRHITLNIERATSTNAGVYTCSATNKFGSKEKRFIVKIRDDSPSNFPFVVLVLILLLVFIIFIVVILILRQKKNKTGHYEVQSGKEFEMRPLSNGGPE